MPPKPKITKDMILTTILSITRNSGFEAVNARSIAGELHCSTRPIFTCYENMEELKQDFLEFAYAFYRQYVEQYRISENVNPSLLLPLSYIAFSREETQLFKLLFVSDMDFDMKEEHDFYNEMENERKALEFAALMGIDSRQARSVFLDLFLYSHGMAVLTADGKLSLNREQTETMLCRFLSAQISQTKSEN